MTTRNTPQRDGEADQRHDARAVEALADAPGGAGVGIAIVASLFVFGQELSSYSLIVAALLAITVLPRYLERALAVQAGTPPA